MVQLLSAPLMATVPVGVVPDPPTLTLTATDWPGEDGLGVCVMMVVELVVPDDATVWLSVSEVLA